MIKKIGVLTSGGDAPGMNAAIRAVVKSGLSMGMEVWGINNGYKGLLEGDMFLMNRMTVADIITTGGTILGSARLPEFVEVDVQKKGVYQLRTNGIEALVCIGGDGTFRGAKALTALGINCVGIPSTIDNDIGCTDYTIGFNTAVNTIVEAVDRLRDTSASHHRCMIVEVMGNHCGDLALYSGLASGADIIVTPDTGFSEEKLLDNILRLDAIERKRHCIVIVAEKITNVEKLAEAISEKTPFAGRATILGHIQRGGSPTPNDRILATRLGDYAVRLLAEGKGGICLGEVGGKLVYYDIMDGLAIEKVSDQSLYDIQSRVKYYG